MRTTGTHHLQSTSCVGAEACFIGAALLAQEPFAFRTVVITGASALRVQTPVTALPRSRGHYSHCSPPSSAGAMPLLFAKAALRAAVRWFVAEASGKERCAAIRR